LRGRLKSQLLNLSIFDIGNSYHDRYAKYLEAAGIHIDCEKPVNDDVRGVRGRLDNVVKIGDITYIVEFKTAPLKNWKYIADKANSKHRLQIGYYMQQTGIHHGLIIYLAKGAVPEDEGGVEVDFPMVEHYVKYTKKLGDAVDRSIGRLSKALEMLPELTVDVDRTECVYCSFRHTCEFSRIFPPPTTNLFEMIKREKTIDLVNDKEALELNTLDSEAVPPILLIEPEPGPLDSNDFWKNMT
jgi:CRISPR/Cas system-associated exonuclease Cas4 (RecB family)